MAEIFRDPYSVGGGGGVVAEMFPLRPGAGRDFYFLVTLGVSLI